MARKGQIAIQDSIETNEEFEAYLMAHSHQLICVEVYSEFCGHCLATSNAVRRGKLEIGQDNIAMAKALSDNIDVISRFKDKSEPVFLFITKGKLTRAMFGANGIELCRIIEEELQYLKEETETGIERPKIDIGEMLPEEAKKLQDDTAIEEEYRVASERLRVLTLASRKRRVCERLSKNVQRLNYIMFWPHCHHAHYDLYENWDLVNITVGAKETIQLDEQTAKEALYMSDVDPNEACLYALLKGEVMIVLFKMFETDTRDFVKVLRTTLYVDIPIPKDDVPPEKQLPPVPAYERYATISKTARGVRRERYEAKQAKLREEKADRERLAAERARIAREMEEEILFLEKQRQEEERIRRIQAGLPPEHEVEVVPAPEPSHEQVEGEEKAETEATEATEATEGTEVTEATPVTEIAPEGEAPEDVKADVGDDVVVAAEEEHVEAEEEFDSDIEVEGEDYIPPSGLFVPGLYAPANELAKANGLALFYPKVVSGLATIESEYLPPHVLVVFTIEKRFDVQDIIKQYESEILAVGVFAGDDPLSADHVAYSIKQYEKMERIRRHKDKLALMVSRKRSLPLLQLAGLNPCYISADLTSGERDCLQLFPVGYGDGFEDEQSDVEEETAEVIPVAEPEPEPEAPAEEKEDDDDDEEEEPEPA